MTSTLLLLKKGTNITYVRIINEFVTCYEFPRKQKS